MRLKILILFLALIVPCRAEILSFYCAKKIPFTSRGGSKIVINVPLFSPSWGTIRPGGVRVVEDVGVDAIFRHQNVSAAPITFQVGATSPGKWIGMPEWWLSPYSYYGINHVTAFGPFTETAQPGEIVSSWFTTGALSDNWIPDEYTSTFIGEGKVQILHVASISVVRPPSGIVDTSMFSSIVSIRIDIHFDPADPDQYDYPCFDLYYDDWRPKVPGLN